MHIVEDNNIRSKQEKENKGMRFQNHSKPGIHPSLLFSPSNNIPIPPIICQRKENLKKIKDYKVIEQIMLDPSKKVKIEVNKIMNPAFLLGTAFNIAYWHEIKDCW